MAKSKRQISRRSFGGPHLLAALFCDQIIEEREGTLSAIRIIDTMTLNVPSGVPKEQQIKTQTAFLLVLKSGNSPGKHEIRIDLRSPSGKVKRGQTQILELSPQPNGGANVRASMTIGVKQGGVFWADVYLDGKPVAHAPLSITVERTAEADHDAGKPASSKKPLLEKKPRQRPSPSRR